ncbi:MAG: head maturation protease, ClpP-related [Desulfitobacteriaceae bacterium]
MRFWNFIKNEGSSDEEIELRISGEIVDDDIAWLYEWFGITAASPNSFRDALAEHKGKDITVWIDSPGGDVFAGAGMYNALKEHKGKVTVKIDGKAMSAASVIAMAGDEIKMSPVGVLMIHNPLSSVRWGEAKDMRHAADVLDEVKETIVNAYQIKTKRSRNKISQLMDDETWMGARKALSEGFIDEMLYTDQQTDPAIENSFMFSGIAMQNSVSANMDRFTKFYEQNVKKTDPPSGSIADPPSDPPTDPPNAKQENTDLLFSLQRKAQANKNKIRSVI